MMAESSSSKSSGRVNGGGHNRQRGTSGYSRRKYNRSSSEHRNKKLPKVDLYRSQSSQCLPQENPKEDDQVSKFLRHCFVSEEIFQENLSFFTRVNCPFCLEVQKDKSELVRHLDDNCKKRKRNYSKLSSIFQILPNNSFKCNICAGEILLSVEMYFVHVHSPGHIFGCSAAVQKGKRLSEFLYCSCCYVHVPDNFTELEAHLLNRIHKLRGIEMTPADFKKKGVFCIYYFFQKKRTFRCLACPASNCVFSSALEIIQHLKAEKHLINMNHRVEHKVYCCFCKMECNAFEIPFHFASAEHLESVAAAEEGEYELCFYCGFSCGNLTDLSTHMRLGCYEIRDIRKGNKTGEGTKESETEMKDEEKTSGKPTKESMRLSGSEIQDIRKENKTREGTKESETEMKDEEKTVGKPTKESMRLSGSEIQDIRKENKTREGTKESETEMKDEEKTSGKPTKESMRLSGSEIQDIRKENKTKEGTKESEKMKGNEREIEDKGKTSRKQVERKRTNKEDRCILVKDDVEVVDLLKLLKTFGKINSVTKYNQEYLMFEFENESSIKNICLIRHLLRIGNKQVCITFLGDIEEDEAGEIPSDESDAY